MNNGSNVEDKYGQELDRKIWITKGSRFNAHQRLMRQHNWSVAAVALLSTYVMIFTFLLYIPVISLTTNQKDIISFSSIAFSLLILVTSLLEASKSYPIKAMEFHNCGRELAALYNKLRQTLSHPESDISKQITEISGEYESALSKCQENHDVVDYDTFRIQHRKEFDIGLLFSFWLSLKGWTKSYLFYLLLCVGPPIGIIIWIFTS